MKILCRGNHQNEIFIINALRGVTDGRKVFATYLRGVNSY